LDLISLKAQTVALIIVLKRERRQEVIEMYNDHIMFMYIVLCIYSRMKNRVMLSALFLSLGASVKAGTLLLLPTYLGSIQLYYGTRTLIMTVLFLVFFQVVISLPFVLGETSVIEYINRSRLLGSGRGGVAFTEEFFDWVACKFLCSLHFKFVSQDFYYDKNGLAKWCWRAIPALNVYYFFIRKQALMPCLNNLRDFLSLKPDKNNSHTKNTLELLLTGFSIGVTFMPGASVQF
jgi:hypothetical protein